MVGRNEKCPCGSGKKYKVCCLNDTVSILKTPSSPEENLPGSFFAINDPKYEKIKNDLREIYPYEKKNPHFLYEIGEDLGLLGNPHDGLLYLNKALKHTKKKDTSLKYAILLDIAAMYAQIGEHSTAMKYLGSVPDGHGRKNVIEANIRLEIEPFENIIHLYENAIEDEPNFFLPYEHLITRLSFDDCKRDFLIDKALKEMPNNPFVLIYWAERELVNFNYKALGSIEWINEMRSFDPQSSPEQGRINFIEDLSTVIDTLELIHELSKTLDFIYENDSIAGAIKGRSIQLNEVHAPDLIQLAINCLPKVPKRYKCLISHHLIACAINIATPEYIELFGEYLCDTCKKKRPLKQDTFSSMYRRIKINEIISTTNKDMIHDAMNLAKRIIDNDEQLTDDFVNSFFDLIDDDVSSDLVLEYAKNIFDNDSDRVSFSNIYEKYRLFWNLAIVSAKANLWGLSRHFYEKISTIDIEDVLEPFCERGYGVKENSKKILADNRLLLPIYISLTYLGEKNITNAKAEIAQIVEDPVMQTELEEDIQSINAIISWTSDNLDSETFKNDFRVQLQKNKLDSWIGQKPKIMNPDNLEPDIFTLFSRTDIGSQIRLHQTMSYNATINSSDLSEIINSLEELIPNFRILPENTKNSLISAENYKFNAKTQFDFSPSIMSFCKALEIYLKSEIFENYAANMRSSEKYEEYISAALNDAKITQFRSLITFLKSGYLEIGSAAQCLKLCTGRSAERVELLNKLKSYLQNSFPMLLDIETTKNIQYLSKNFRNPAVHEINFGIDELIEVRQITANIFNSMIGHRLIKSID